MLVTLSSIIKLLSNIILFIYYCIINLARFNYYVNSCLFLPLLYYPITWLGFSLHIYLQKGIKINKIHIKMNKKIKVYLISFLLIDESQNYIYVFTYFLRMNSHPQKQKNKLIKIEENILNTPKT